MGDESGEEVGHGEGVRWVDGWVVRFLLASFLSLSLFFFFCKGGRVVGWEGSIVIACMGRRFHFIAFCFCLCPDLWVLRVGLGCGEARCARRVNFWD